MIIHPCPDYRLNLDGECLICKLEKHCDDLQEINDDLQNHLDIQELKFKDMDRFINSKLLEIEKLKEKNNELEKEIKEWSKYEP